MLVQALERCAVDDSPAPLPESLTKAEVMRCARLSLSSVNRLLKRGELLSRKVGRRSIRIPRAAVEALLSTTSLN
jgi:excisionase family DNA binding protein